MKARLNGSKSGEVDTDAMPPTENNRLLWPELEGSSRAIDPSSNIPTISARDRIDRDALAAMRRDNKNTEGVKDARAQLITCTHRAVEFDLPDHIALATIKAYAAHSPSEIRWSDSEILERLRAAETKTPRGNALVERRCTDVGNAERFAIQHGDDLRYIHAWDKWLVWNGRRWQIDDSGEVYRRAKQTAKSIYREAADVDESAKAQELCKWAKASQASGRIDAMVKLARSESSFPITHKSLDSHPWLLNCDNGTVDLKTGILLPHDRIALHTKSTGIAFPHDLETPAPLWTEFLSTTFGGDAMLIGFMQRLLGAALPGVQIEHLAPIAHGSGANGKTVFTSVVQAALGDYAMTASPGLLMNRRHESHPTDLADLYGKRLVILSETKDGQKLDEGMVKAVTGGDLIRARRMRENFWEFAPSHLPLIVTNHKPVVRGTDYGIWRRLRLIPFNVTIPPERQDKHLTEKLLNELPAILRWMVAGCLDWQRTGLRDPPCVLAATEQYRVESDTFAQWFAEQMVVDQASECKAADAFRNYRDWCEQASEQSLNQTQFGQRMIAHISHKRVSNGVWYVGVRLRNFTASSMRAP